MGQSKYHVSHLPTVEPTTKKNTLRCSQALSARVQGLRQDYWAQVRAIDLKDLVFLDEMGVLLGFMRTHARATPGARADDFKPFYRGRKVSVIGAISVSKVLAVMTMDDSMHAAAFEVSVSQCLVPQLWPGAVVVMDNLTSHQVDVIAPLIEAAGAKGAGPLSLLPRIQPKRALVVSVEGFPETVFTNNLENGRYTHCNSDGFNQSEPFA